MAHDYTYRTEIDPATNRPLVWIDRDGHPAVRQPHHPNAVLDPSDPTAGLWTSEEEASAWAQDFITQLVADEQAIAEAAAQEAQKAEEDRARLARIEEMLAELLAR